MVVVTLVPSAGPGVGIVGEVPGVDIVGVLPGVDFVGVKVNTSVVTEMFKLTGIKQKMKEIMTNLGCLWGGRGPVLQPHPLTNSAETAISAILTILGSLWGEVEVLLLLDTSFGDRPPSHW